jgi:hypothetical protein
MQIAATLPARLTGTLVLSHIETGIDSRSYVAWNLDPLPPGSENEIQIDIGQERATREPMLEVAERMHTMRPEVSRWISSLQKFFGKTPATELAYEWLWDDLRRVSWVNGIFNRRHS